MLQHVTFTCGKATRSATHIANFYADGGRPDRVQQTPCAGRAIAPHNPTTHDAAAFNKCRV